MPWVSPPHLLRVQIPPLVRPQSFSDFGDLHKDPVSSEVPRSVRYQGVALQHTSCLSLTGLPQSRTTRGQFKPHECISSCPRSGESEVRVWAGLVCPEASLLGMQMSSPARVLTRSSLCTCPCPAPLFYRTGSSLTLMTSVRAHSTLKPRLHPKTYFGDNI